MELADARVTIERLQDQVTAKRSTAPARYLGREELILLPRLMKLLPPDGQLTVVDAGAREVDADPRWRPFPPTRLRFYGFEADADEAARLNEVASADGAERHFYPAGLWGSTGRIPFEHNKAGGGSSFLQQNRAVTDRWKFENPKEVSIASDMFYPIRTEELTVVSLADWAAREGITSVDFLKINVQGGELEILQGAGPLLDGVLGVFLEVAFVESYRDRPMFSDIDAFLRKQGFSFFDLLAHHYVGRAASPVAAQHLAIVEPKLGQLVTAWGQLVEGHALYFRDPLGTAAAPTMSPDNLIRLAALAEAWGQIEFAFEVLDALSRHPDLAGTPRA
ncbi:FkbM family methyltransferase, partial [Bradyrhizobium sp.]|uniref:FkbM family methyltransferase n=1 Tax=Bradyrhizobium sp. TaxID=376 RepID=UPI001ECDB2C4